MDLSNAAFGAGLLGVALLTGSAWALRRELALFTPSTVAAVVSAAVGGAIILGALAVAASGAPSAGEAARRVLDALSALARGDLVRATPEPAPGGGVLAPIVRSLGEAVQSLRDQGRLVRDHTREVSSRAGDLAAQSASLPTSAQRTTEQLSLAGHRVTALREVLHGTQGDAARAREAAQQLAAAHRDIRARATRAADEVRGAADDVDVLTQEVGRVAGGLAGAADDLQALARATDEIREFASLVRKMARQSKLLALNAAMEAARAGEQGSGFAVVAGEVRRLAKSSTDAAERTEALVRDVLERAERSRLGTLHGSDALAATLARLAEAVAVLRLQEREWRADGSPGVTGAPSGAETLSAGALAEAVAERLAQVVEEGDVLGGVVRDAHLSAGAHLARTQDVAALAATLARAAERAATIGAAPRIDAPATGPALPQVSANDESAERGVAQEPSLLTA